MIRDNLIAIKMMRDSQSLAYFHSLKDDYELDLQEKADALAYMVETMKLLRRVKIEIRHMQVPFSSASALSFQAGIDTADALHVAWAMEQKCKYFVTTDERLIEKVHENVPIGIQAVKPPTLHQFPEIRAH